MPHLVEMPDTPTFYVPYLTFCYFVAFSFCIAAFALPSKAYWQASHSEQRWRPVNSAGFVGFEEQPCPNQTTRDLQKVPHGTI